MNMCGLGFLKILAGIMIIILEVHPGPAQQSKTLQEISGLVKDVTGGILPQVQVSIPDLRISAICDDAGRYTLKGVPSGKVVVHASFPGFSDKNVEVFVPMGQNVKLDLILELRTRSETVTVEYAAPKLMTASDSIGVVSIVPQQVSTLPSLGEKDLFRAFQLMPGISASNESSSGLYVRGGTPDQNLLIFDGFSLYKVDHFFGIFSAFNANAVENTTISKGGFDSKYGGRLSSVVDVVGKTGNKKEMEVGGGLSLLSYNSYIDGPLGKKGTFMIAGRRSYQSPFSNRIRNSYSNTSRPGPGGGMMGMFSSQPLSSFYDVNGKVTFSVSQKDNLTFAIYKGQDDFDNSRTISMPSFGANQNKDLGGDITDLSNWGNTAFSVNWTRSWTAGFSSKLTFASSRYLKNAANASDMKVVDPETNTTRKFDNSSSEDNSLKDRTFRLSNSLIVGRKHYIEFGAESTEYKTDYAYVFNTDAGQLHRIGHGRQLAFYLQDRFQPFSKLEITPGIRTAHYSITDRLYLEPRLSFILHATNKFRLKAAGGNYYQFTNDLTREDPMGGDQDFWSLADGSTIPVSRAVHYIGGASYELRNYLFDIEAYRKNLNGLTEFGMFRLGAKPPSPGERPEVFDFTKSFFTGAGIAQGIDVLLQKKFGADTGWITYTLGRVKHYFPDLSASPYPASHDSTHEFKIVNSYSFRRFIFSGTWIYATGKPVTEPTGFEEITTPGGRVFYMPTLGDKNGSRLPDYHRLDLSASVELWKKEDHAIQTGVSVFNAYNRSNVWRRQYQVVDGEIINNDAKYLGLTVSAFVNINQLTPPAKFLDALVPPGGSARSIAGLRTTAQSAEPEQDTKPTRKSALSPGKEYDIFGNIVTIDANRVAVRAASEVREFILGQKSVLGEPNYEPGAFVHVHYRNKPEGDVVTMLVRKVKNARDIPSGVLNTLDPLRPRRF